MKRLQTALRAIARADTPEKIAAEIAASEEEAREAGAEAARQAELARELLDDDEAEAAEARSRSEDRAGAVPRPVLPSCASGWPRHVAGARPRFPAPSARPCQADPPSDRHDDRCDRGDCGVGPSSEGRDRRGRQRHFDRPGAVSRDPAAGSVRQLAPPGRAAARGAGQGEPAASAARTGCSTRTGPACASAEPPVAAVPQPAPVPPPPAPAPRPREPFRDPPPGPGERQVHIYTLA